MSEFFEEELDELQDDLQDVVDDGLESVDDLDQLGQTSDEVTESTEAEPAAKRPSRGQAAVRSFTVFDAMLLMSLVCITLAAFLMFYELTTFGKFPGFVWRTDEAAVEASR